MMKKQSKTNTELARMVVAEARKHPECAHIRTVDIVPTGREASYQPNWVVAWGRSGSPSERCEVVVGGFVTTLQNKFDLA